MTARESFHLRPDGEKAFGYAQAVKAGGFLHIAGVLAVDDAFATVAPGDMAGQVRAVYATLEQVLARFGLSFADMVKETIFVTDMDDFIAANGERLARYAGFDLPAATAVQVSRLAFPGNMIEVEAVALAGGWPPLRKTP
jgi:enamine deaminase RidA (YjgF/YER057c/UK114 family)